MSDFDINICVSYTNMILSILDRFWQKESIVVSEDSRVLTGGALVRVFEDSFPAAAPIKSGTVLALAESVNNILHSLGFTPLDKSGSVMRYRCPGSQNYVAVSIAEETTMRKEKAA